MSLPRPKPIPVQTRHQEVQQQHDDSGLEKELQARHPSWSADSISAVVSVFSPPHLGPRGDSLELQQWNNGNCRRSDGDVHGEGSIHLDCPGSCYPDSTASPGDCGESLSPPPPPSPASSLSSAAKGLPLLSSFLAFWGSHIAVAVPSKSARDHLALERTYLAYYRTSLVFAMLAAINAQLTVLQHSPSRSTIGLTFQSLGIPLSIALISLSLVITLVGGFRWWRLQNGLVRGVALTGGLEVWGIAGGVGAILVVVLGLLLAAGVGVESRAVQLVRWYKYHTGEAT